MALCVSVAIDDIVLKIDKLYDYVVPEQLIDVVKPGVRVVIPFSRSNIRKKGLVLKIHDVQEVYHLKYVIGVADDEPVINQTQLELVDFLKKRYFVTYYKAFKSIVPRGIDYKINEKYRVATSCQLENQDLYAYIKSKRDGVKYENIPKEYISDFKKELDLGNIIKDFSFQKRNLKTNKILVLKIEREELEKRLSELDKRFERQRDLMALFLDCESIQYHDAIYYTGCTMSTVNSLAKKGILDIQEQEIINNPYQNMPRCFDCSPIELSDDQQKVYNDIVKSCDQYATHLIHGVTGSGKTLVYMSLIDKMIAEKKSVIFMVPEISLTPQMLSRFYMRYGDNVAVVHSGLSTSERTDEWNKIKSLESCVVVGTRSSVFSPVNNLGMIIIDEEHESSYKSESSPRYHARDISKTLCRKFSVPLVLGSATPSIESFFFSQKGKYVYHSLDKRYNNSLLPKVDIVDMTESFREGEQSFLSSELKEAIQTNIDNGEQTILFLNRRGANPIVGCRSCGFVAKCPNCDISLTFHSANNRCMCHYCGYSIKAFEKCPECSSKHIKKLGIGTQLVYSEIEKIFPSASVLRMDLDTVTSHLSYGEKLSDFKNGKYNIMLGTQMVAKGLDFPDVTLVGVINADLSLHVSDFRSAERTFSLLTQVCGRSGRSGKEGRAIIQTYSPDNVVINYAKDQNYIKYFEHEIKFRKAFNFPPFCDIVHFTVSSKKEADSYSDVMKLYKLLDELSNNEFNDIPIRLLYPTTPKIICFNKKYRYSLVIKSKLVNRLYDLLDKVNVYFAENCTSEISININPMSIL